MDKERTIKELGALINLTDEEFLALTGFKKSEYLFADKTPKEIGNSDIENRLKFWIQAFCLTSDENWKAFCDIYRRIVRLEKIHHIVRSHEDDE